MSGVRVVFESALAAKIAEPQPPNTRMNVPRNSAPHFFARMLLSMGVGPRQPLTPRRTTPGGATARWRPSGLQSRPMRRTGGIVVVLTALMAGMLTLPVSAGAGAKPKDGG